MQRGTWEFLLLGGDINIPGERRCGKEVKNFNYISFLSLTNFVQFKLSRENFQKLNSMRMKAQISPTKFTARANQKMTKDLTQMSQSFSAEIEDPRKLEEKQKREPRWTTSTTTFTSCCSSAPSCLCHDFTPRLRLIRSMLY